METLEELNLRVRGSLYTLTIDQLKDVGKHVKLENMEDKTKMNLISMILAHLDSDDVTKSTDGGKGHLGAIEDLITLITTSTTTTSSTSTSTTSTTTSDSDSTTTTTTSDSTMPSFSLSTKLVSALTRREFKIQGTIGAASPKDQLSYLSVTRQLEDGIAKGYSASEIINALIRAMPSGLEFRRYLECRSDLTLPQVRRLLRTHYREGGAHEIHQQLLSASQGSKETPQEFLIRCMNLRQKIIFASQEDGATYKYSEDLVKASFFEALQTGLTGRLRGDMRQYLQDPDITDTELLEKLTMVENLEQKRVEKRGAKANTNAISSEPEPLQSQTTTDIKEIMAGMKALQATVAALQEAVHQPKASTPNQTDSTTGRRRARGCRQCKADGIGDQCNHCYKCGSADHFARGCRVRQQKGNGSRLPRGDRV